MGSSCPEASLPDLKPLKEMVSTLDTIFISHEKRASGWLLMVLQKEHASKQEIGTALMEAVRHIDTLDTENAQQWQQAIFYLYLLILHRRSIDRSCSSQMGCLRETRNRFR